MTVESIQYLIIEQNERNNMLDTSSLYQLHTMLEKEYKQYKDGSISEKQYLTLIKPIDEAIDNIEISTLQDTLALKGSSLLLSHKQES